MRFLLEQRMVQAERSARARARPVRSSSGTRTSKNGSSPTARCSRTSRRSRRVRPSASWSEPISRRISSRTSMQRSNSCSVHSGRTTVRRRSTRCNHERAPSTPGTDRSCLPWRARRRDGGRHGRCGTGQAGRQGCADLGRLGVKAKPRQGSSPEGRARRDLRRAGSRRRTARGELGPMARYVHLDVTSSEDWSRATDAVR